MSDTPLVTYSVELLEATINKQVDRIEQLEAALRFYADISHYAGPIIDDCGRVARAALAPEKER